VEVEVGVVVPVVEVVVIITDRTMRKNTTHFVTVYEFPLISIRRNTTTAMTLPMMKVNI
jgi:hypothetical protein